MLATLAWWLVTDDPAGPAAYAATWLPLSYLAYARMRVWADGRGIAWRRTGVRTTRVGWDELVRVEVDHTGQRVPGVRLRRSLDGPPVDVPMKPHWRLDERREFERLVREHLGPDGLVVHPPWGTASRRSG